MFRIVDERHSCAFLLKVDSENEAWHGSQWAVALTAGEHSLNVLKQIARWKNAEHSER